MTARLSPQIEPLPETMSHLRVDPDRGMPVPWFVAWIDGKPEFRMADGAKFATAVKQNRCWVCGRRNDPGRLTFVVGPMCGINRVSSEPPSHLICARYSARTCPFLTKPQMTRRGEEEIAQKGTCAGEMISRNPGVTLLWTQARCVARGDGKGGTLFVLEDPLELEFFARGRHATREEVDASVESGLPVLQRLAEADGPAASYQLAVMRGTFAALLDRCGTKEER